MGRQARGVIGMRLGEGQRVISMLVAADENRSVLTATEHGFGKRTSISEYTRHGRGTQGMIAIQTTERNGKLVGAALVQDKDEIMLISTSGVLIRMKVDQIREMGRSTQGVSLISLDAGTRLAGVQRIVEAEEVANGNGDGNGSADHDNGEGSGGNGRDGEGAHRGNGQDVDDEAWGAPDDS